MLLEVTRRVHGFVSFVQDNETYKHRNMTVHWGGELIPYYTCHTFRILKNEYFTIKKQKISSFTVVIYKKCCRYLLTIMSFLKFVSRAIYMASGRFKQTLLGSWRLVLICGFWLVGRGVGIEKCAVRGVLGGGSLDAQMWRTRFVALSEIRFRRQTTQSYWDLDAGLKI